MKLKRFARVIGTNLIILTAGLFFSGCVGIQQTYPGQSLPRDQIAFIKTHDHPRQGFTLEMIDCDGIMIQHSRASGFTHTSFAFSALPGKHTIKFVAIGFAGYSTGFVPVGRCDKDFTVEAGGTYLATGNLTNTGLSVDIVKTK
jgi:hypothetical protein